MHLQRMKRCLSGMPGSADLRKAHGLLMQGLIDDAGCFRSGGVGIYRGERLLHMAPPASRVQALMNDLLNWLTDSDLHPLIVSCVFHYEFEFIHPFADGNGRMGRLWQTLILSRWRPVLAYLPVETVIRDQQQAYYAALSASDQLAEATPFVEFMLLALQQALLEVDQVSASTAQVTAQVTAHVTEPVLRLLRWLVGKPPLSAGALMDGLGLNHRQSFRRSYLAPALDAGLIEMTLPNALRSPSQAYRLTKRGLAIVSAL